MITGQPNKERNDDGTLQYLYRGAEYGKDGTYQGNKEGPVAYRGGALYAGVIYRGRANFVGINSEKGLHTVQNAIHYVMDVPRFEDLNYCPKAWSYFGDYRVTSLVY